MKRTVVYLFIFQLLSHLTYCREACNFEMRKKAEKVFVKQGTEDYKVSKESDWEPIRIHYDLTSLESSNHPKEDIAYIRDIILPKATEVIQKILKVKRNKKTLIVKKQCLDGEFADKYVTTGVDADVLILVEIQRDLGVTRSASAARCQQHEVTRRPIAGYMDFRHNVTTSVGNYDQWVWTALHELTHLLVFDFQLYGDFIDPATLERKKREDVFGTRVYGNGKKSAYLKTPKIVEKGRKHYGCPTLEGVPIIDYTNDIEIGSHWSSRYLNSEYMVSGHYGEDHLSEMTLALFEDSGWYKPDYEMANLFMWGRNKGCDFFNDKCVTIKDEDSTTKYPGEFCTEMVGAYCSISNVYRASCGIRDFKEDLPVHQRYFFNDPKKGGIFEDLDRCPVVEDAIGSRGSCRTGNSPKFSFEKICPECACFISTIDGSKSFRFSQSRKLRGKRSSQPEPSYSSCFQYSCKEGELYVLINGKSYKCQDNTNISIEGFTGYVKCPSKDLICNPKYNCRFGCTERYTNSNPK